MKASLDVDQLPDTQRRLLDATIELVMRQGFTATTVDEICLKAELTKGSFFHYFKSKDEIGEKALEHYCAKMGNRMASAPFHRVDDPLEKIYAFLDHFTAMAQRPEIANGCLIGDLAQELSRTHPKIRRQCEAAFGRISGIFAGFLNEAKAAHPPKVDFDPMSVATLFASVMQGSMVLAKARHDKQVILDNLEHYRAYIDSLFGRTGLTRRRSTS